MIEFCDYESMIRNGRIMELRELIKKDRDVLISQQKFSGGDTIFQQLWERQPAITRKVLLELLEGEDAIQMIRMLEHLSMNLQFTWERCRCYVKGNVLFSMVWNGEHRLVKRMLELGMEPNGTSYGMYLTKEGEYIRPHSRWGKMKCKLIEDDFFSNSRWYDPWSIYEEDRNAYLITPLYLAELQQDEEMISLLKKAGACTVPSREKMWKEAGAEKIGR